MTAVAPPAGSAAAHGLPELAPLLRRAASLGYESLLLAAIILLAGFIVAPMVSPVASADPAVRVPPAGARILSACGASCAAGVYFVWSWSGGRRTLPMKTWRMALACTDGRSVDTRTAVIRFLAAWIGPLAALVAYVALESAGLGPHAAWLIAFNFLWALIDRDRQFLHDRIAGTRIVMAPATLALAPVRRPR